VTIPQSRDEAITLENSFGSDALLRLVTAGALCTLGFYTRGGGCQFAGRRVRSGG